MALSLGVKVGSKISVGEHCVEVKSLAQPNLIVVSVDGGEGIAVSDQSKTRILPDVAVFSGVGQNGSGNRLAFEASPHIKILRMK